MEKMENREQKFLSKIERKLAVTTEKLQEIRESFSQRITSVEEKVLDLEKTVDGKLSTSRASDRNQFELSQKVTVG